MKNANVPVLATVCIVVFVVAAVTLVIFGEEDNQTLIIVLGLITTSTPSLIAALFAERASKDIRNGVVVEKAREGAAQAIQEQQVVTRDGPVATAELRALNQLLDMNAAALGLTRAQQRTEDDGQA